MNSDYKIVVEPCGSKSARVVFVLDSPDRRAVYARKADMGECGILLDRMAAYEGIKRSDRYITHIMKKTPARSKMSASEVSRWLPGLIEEIDEISPEIVVVVGAHTWSCLGLGKYINFSDIKGYPYKGKIVRRPGGRSIPEIESVREYLFLPIFNPEFVSSMPNEHLGVSKAMSLLGRMLRGYVPENYVPDYSVLDSPDKIDEIHHILSGMDAPTASIDCEWHGAEWYKTNKYVRTVQLCVDGEFTFVVKLFNVISNNSEPDPVDNFDDMVASLDRLLTKSGMTYIGHNVKEDIQWLYACTGIDITNSVIYDTMLGETLINQMGPFGLEDLALKYTNIGRWSVTLSEWWKKAPPAHKRDGFGFIPDEILLPYSAIDVIATYEIAQKQFPILADRGYASKRGYMPSLLEDTMQVSSVLVEIERTGMPVDKDMLIEMIRVFESRASSMLADIQKSAEPIICKWLARTKGVPVSDVIAERAHKNIKYNPGSSRQTQDLLFKALNIRPFKTTNSHGGRLWSDAVGNISLDDMDAFDELSASTDATTLTVLSSEHPIVDMLLNYSKVNQLVTTWLRTPIKDPSGHLEGGLMGNMGEDGALHPSFRMGLSTGRLATKSPNSQNFVKRAQKFLKRIFKEELETDEWLVSQGRMPSIRNIIVPPEGMVIMEGDFIQAELFVLAALSGDVNMWRALNTPGLDLHTKTACDGFGIRRILPDGSELLEEELLEVAGKLWRDRGGGTEDFDASGYEKELDNFYHTLSFVPSIGDPMTYDQFKETARVSAKSVNFGIPYGRGDQSIAILIKVETGSPLSIPELTSQVGAMMDTWKKVSYPDAWRYMHKCSVDAQVNWEVMNPLGRSRLFVPTKNPKALAGYGRQGSNMPIQSTVADACNRAVCLMAERREELGLGFKFFNLVHDAIMTFVPKDEIEVTKKLYKETMGNVPIPTGTLFDPLILGVDVEVSDRWGM